MLEASIELSILDALNKLPGCLAVKYKTVGASGVDGVFRKQNRYILAGTADILGVHQGIFFAIEVKTAKGKTSSKQDAFLQKVRDCGGKSGIAKSIEDALGIVLSARKD